MIDDRIAAAQLRATHHRHARRLERVGQKRSVSG